MAHKPEDWIILERLGDVVLQHVPGSIIEIGIGVSTQILIQLAAKFKVPFFSCDIDKKRCDWAKGKLKHSHAFHGRSFDFLHIFATGEMMYSLILIDGDHKYSTVSWEVKKLLPILNIGGLMFLHDTCKQSWDDIYLKTGTSDSYLVRRELEANPALQVVTFPYTAANMGLTMVMKKDMDAPIFRR